MTLRNVSVVFILLLLSPASPVDSQNLKVGYPSIGGAQTPLFVAKESGAFRRQGLNVETIFIAGGNRVVQAMIAGDIQFGQVSQAPAISASLAGADLVFIANLYPTLVYSLWVAPEIKRPADLKGKKLGITSFGSVIDFGTQLFLKKFNLIPDKDVALIQVGGQNNAVAALAAKAIQGCLLNPPASIEAKKLGAQELFDLRELGVDYAFVGVAVSRAYWNRNPDVVERFTKAYVEGISIAKRDPGLTTRVLGKYTKATDQKELAETYRVFVTNTLLDKPYTTDQGIQANLDGLGPKLKAAQNAKPQTFYDNQIIDKLDKSGYIKSLYQ
jgi:NitT/TauT family transport system substrate-binding protein